MLTPPPDFDEELLLQSLRVEWGFAADELEYLPLGFGSHHWCGSDTSGSKRFVKVDAIAAPGKYQHLKAAYTTALALQQHGMAFVLAPLPTIDGEAMTTIKDTYVVSLYPMLDGISGSFDDLRSACERDEAAQLLLRLHAATDVGGGVTRVDDLAIDARSSFETALARLDSQWMAGPYGERARALLRPNIDLVTRALRRYDALAEQTAKSRGRWVVTHGEPHPGNFIRTETGLFLIDWDTVLLAAPERDLWLLSTDVEQLGKYSAGSPSIIEPEKLRFFDLRWQLTDIALFTTDFAAAHRASDNLERSLELLARSIRCLRRLNTRA